MNPRGIRTSDYVTLSIIAVIVVVHSISARNALAPTSLTLLFYIFFGLALLTRWLSWLVDDPKDSPVLTDLVTMSGPLVMVSYALFVVWVVFDW